MQVNRLDYSREKQILVYLITNTEYCRRVLPVLEPDYFRSKSALRIILWVESYYNSYKTAPGSHILSIFENETAQLDKEEKEQIESVLTHISDTADTENQNLDYLVEVAFKYCKSRLLELQVLAAQKHINEGHYELAEEALLKRFEAKSDRLDAVAWDDKKLMRDTIDHMVQGDDPEAAFFRYSGKLGDFIGNMNRSWFVAFIAPSKRGKTIYLVETIIEAILQGKNVVFFSLEMPTVQLYARVLKSVIGNKPNDTPYEVMTPIFDCVANQNGECAKDTRKGFSSLEIDGQKMSYEDSPGWVVCTECRGTSDFKPTSWKIPVKKEALNESEYFNKANAFMKLYGKRCRTIFYPSKSATVSELITDLETLEHDQNFIADVVVIDYADLLKPARGGEKRHELDAIWEELRAIEQDKNVLLVTASQTNRGAVDAKYVKDSDIAEDYSKIAKLDLGIGLCQSEKMKDDGIMHINKVIYRHGEFLQSKTCMVLQELGNMQGILDSEFN